MTQEQPLFSIVIPSYNREDLIMETLESVFQQTCKDYEIIVVDNASTDNTVERLQPLVDEGRIRLMVNSENIERASARNVGFKAANGKFVTLLDSDDFMYSNNLASAADFIARNPDCHFFHNYYELVNDEKKLLNSYRYPPESKQLKRLAMGNFISCIGVFLSQEVLSKYLFNEDPKILGSEDWELWVRIRAEYRLGVIPEVNNGVRFHTGRSISSYNLTEVVKRKEYIIEGLLKNEMVNKTFGQFENDMRAAVYVFAATSANESGLFEEAKKYLKTALKLKSKLILDPHFMRVAQIANFKLSKKYFNRS